MRKIYYYIVLSLMASLFIYMFYRTENTVINEIIISLTSLDGYLSLRDAVAAGVPLNDHIIYSLPEGLWVFCITLISKFFFVKIRGREVNLIYVPLIISIGLELCQLFNLTNGRFDFWDIGLSVLFWAAGVHLFKHESSRQNIMNPFTIKSMVCLFTYLIIYLAHVWK